MGLARATLLHGEAIGALQPKLLALARRRDLHVINKVHITRCLEQFSKKRGRAPELEALLNEINYPPRGIVVNDNQPSIVKSTSDFRFDYEFKKNEISSLARLFNVAETTVEDAIVAEITQRWPEATSLDFFPGHERYRRDRRDRYELYREHIQKHALLNAATTLSKTLPVVVRSYEIDGNSPWLEWRDRYDITFDDGSWLSDRKDLVPPQAKEYLLGKRIDQQETLQDQQTVLRKLGFVDAAADALFPLYGSWSSPDGVGVSITSALTERKGAIGRCMAFSKKTSHDLWLPAFWDDGYYNHNHRQESPFAPLVWAPETHTLGIDVGDEIAAVGAGGRPRLGIDLTNRLELANETNGGDWRTVDGRLALRSQVWGNWKPDPDSRSPRHEDGEILWATPEWLAAALVTLNRRLVFTVTLWKYRSSRDYAPSNGVKTVLVGLRNDDGMLRLWQAKKASKQDY